MEVGRTVIDRRPELERPLFVEGGDGPAEVRASVGCLVEHRVSSGGPVEAWASGGGLVEHRATSGGPAELRDLSGGSVEQQCQAVVQRRWGPQVVVWWSNDIRRWSGRGEGLKWWTGGAMMSGGGSTEVRTSIGCPAEKRQALETGKLCFEWGRFDERAGCRGRKREEGDLDASNEERGGLSKVMMGSGEPRTGDGLSSMLYTNFLQGTILNGILYTFLLGVN
ncbi:hypothetical protein MA16_Dca020322 [Dendrobium catenatum]|uniref:Uncharacterized protein n=1 Tax=Dendrobium catenatum TaxID=906689 RepID=A0A2I0X197_9ASPA|nr:hypothetical protein MA16_Dca020322 [Dendrobium catenatum]